MSKRSEATGVAKSRRRFGIPALRDIRIRPKLGIILIVPVLALVGLSFVRVLDIGQQAIDANEVRTLARFSSSVSELTQAMQVERTAAFDFLDQADRGDASAGEDDKAPLNAAIVATDGALATYYAEEAALPEDMPSNFAAVVRDAHSQLQGLATKRTVTINETTDVARSVTAYNALIGSLLQVHEVLAQNTGNVTLGTDIRVASLLSQMKEMSEREKITVLTTEQAHKFNSTEYRSYIEYSTSRQLASESLYALLTVEKRNEVTQLLDTIETQDATLYEGEIDGVLPGESFDIDYAGWQAAMDARRDQARIVEQQLETAIVASAETLRDEVVTQVLVELALVLLTLTAAVALALIIARSVASSLRQLREGALQMAHVDLPEAVARLRDAESLGQSTPDEFAERIAEPLRLDNRDEIGQVANAFNIVHKEAVRVAAEQAALRSSVSQMFVNLARRSQILVDRLIGHLDRLERGEEDPDRLGELFQLDHLATRMRRNDENLLVLAGADSARIQREPATVGDLLRAAQSEVEQYTRIEFGTILAEREITAVVVNDLVHLIAELFDNATAFSSPDTAVVAEARQVGSEIVILITDRGIGIADQQLDELNDQLSRPPQVDIAASRMMGLVVVARLAQRHGVKVSLRPGELRGTVAEVVLPDAILIDPHGAIPSRPAPSPGRDTAIGAPPPAPSFGSAADAFGPPPEPQRATDAFASFGVGDSPEQPPPPPASSLFTPVSRPSQPPLEDLDDEDVPTLTFRPAGDDSESLPKRKVMELTGEIVSESSEDSDRPLDAPPKVDGPTEAFPMITLEAASNGARRELPGGTGTIPPAAGGTDDEENESRWAALKPPSWPPNRVDGPPGPTPPPTGAPDETMEIPIFREVSSAWFTAAPPPAEQAPEAGAPPEREDLAEFAQPPAPAEASRFDVEVERDDFGSRPVDVPEPRTPAESAPPTRASGPVPSRSPASTDESFFPPAPEIPEVPEAPTPQGRPAPARSHARSTSTRQEERMPSDALPSRPTASTEFWRTSADDGWRAAQAAAARPVESNDKGLPKRTPMAQLVPGGIEEPQEPMRAQQRDPEGVRGLLSAYHRGVQRGRGGRTVDDDASSTSRSRSGRLNNGAGKEHDA